MSLTLFRFLFASLGLVGSVLLVPSCAHADAASTGGDPFGSYQWPDLKREFLGSDPVEFDARVKVLAPAFAEDPMNVPITVSADGLRDVELITVLVDRN
ncbi:MAG: thiosulfate oxidation carrier protein SoxY, partial [Burkholderiales bacterium]